MKKKYLLSVFPLLFLVFHTNAQVSDACFEVAPTYTVYGGTNYVVTADFNKDGNPDIATASYGVNVLLGNPDGTLTPLGSYTVGGGNSIALDTGDFNNDSWIDLAIVNSASDNISILLNVSGTTFTLAGTYSVTAGSYSSSIAAGDFDNDLKLDLVITNPATGSISVFKGNGNGTFMGHVDYPLIVNGPNVVITGHFNNDAMLDIAVANTGNWLVTILLNSAGTFPSSTDYAVNQPSSMTVDDFDKDGDEDIAVANNGFSSATLLFGDNTGTFTVSLVTYATGGSTAFFIKSGDFNGDTKPDLAIVNNPNNDVSVFMGNGDGTFNNPVSYLAGWGTNCVAIADFNQDGKSDMAVSDYWGSDVSILINKNSGSFAAGIDYPAGPIPWAMISADFDKDGDKDIAITHYMGGGGGGVDSISILKNNGSGVFSFPVSYFCGADPTDLVSGDFNGDTWPDIAVTRGGFPAPVSVLLNDGSGGFGPPVDYSFVNASASIDTGDFNNDNILDLVATNFSGGKVNVLLGDGTGAFPTSSNYAVSGNFPISVSAGDFDKDNKIDLAVANNFSNNVSVMKGNGAGGFAFNNNFGTGQNPTYVISADFDNNDTLDLAVACYNNPFGVNVYKGNGDLTFTSASTNPSPIGIMYPLWMATNDFNNDGKLDFVTSNSDWTSSYVYLFLGNGDLTFVTPSLPNILVASNSPSAIVAEDFNNDGVPDIAVTNNGGNNISVFLSSGQSPVAVSSAISICKGTNISISAGTGDSYLWQPSSGLSSNTIVNPVASPTATTTYVLTVSILSCTKQASVKITVNSLPTLITTPGSVICIGDSIVLGAIGATTYTWHPSMGLSKTTGNTVNASPGVTTTYSITGTNSNGCVSTYSVSVSVNPLPSLYTSGNVSICFGNNAVLSATGNAGSYSWIPDTFLSSTSGASVLVSPTLTGVYTYSLIATDLVTTCSDKKNIAVTVLPNPIVVASNDVGICPGISTNLSAMSSAVNIVWSPSTGLNNNTSYNVTASPTITTTYTVTGTDVYSCSSYDAVIVSVNPILIANAGHDVSICYGSSTTLTASGGSTYSWLPTESLSIIAIYAIASPTTTTTYTLNITDPCPTVPDYVTVTVYSLPTITVSSNITICSGSFTTLMAGGAITYSWNPGATVNPNVGSPVNASPSSTTTYTVTGTDSNGCSNYNTIGVAVDPLPLVDAGSNVTIDLGQVITLSASPNNLPGGSYSWSPSDNLTCTNCVNPNANPPTTTVYYLTVNQGACISVDSVLISVICDDVFVPDAFSPNGDGNNDVLYPQSVCIKRLILFTVYNRWGQKVFETSDINKGWDGMYNNTKLETGVFVYMLKAVSLIENNPEISVKGNVSLIR